MQFLSFGDLGSSSAARVKGILQREPVIVTADGEPVGLLMPLKGDPERTVAAVNRARAQEALANLRAAAAAQGFDKWTDEQIDAEIAAVRAEPRDR